MISNDDVIVATANYINTHFYHTSNTIIMGTMHAIHRNLLVAGSVLLTAMSVGAQENGTPPAESPTKTVSLIAGASQFDLSGTGTTALIGARADMELNRWFVGEVGFSTMRPLEQFGERATYIFPEFQFQAQLPLSVVRPYVGVGAGFGTAFARGSGSSTTGTVAAAGGLRMLLPGTSTMLRSELRVRGIGTSFSGSMAEWTLGLGQRF